MYLCTYVGTFLYSTGTREQRGATCPVILLHKVYLSVQNIALPGGGVTADEWNMKAKAIAMATPTRIRVARDSSGVIPNLPYKSIILGVWV